MFNLSETGKESSVSIIVLGLFEKLAQHENLQYFSYQSNKELTIR